MKRVVLYAPLVGNGGIVSWTKRYIKTFPKNEFEVVSVNSIRRDRMAIKSRIKRTLTGLADLYLSLRDLNRLYKETKFSILHATTSGGSGGYYRDKIIGKWCHRHRVKSILHCHYGNIPNVLKAGNKTKDALLDSLRYFDQIWVLDNYTKDALSSYKDICSKIKIVPNNIEVEHLDVASNKGFTDWAFIANLIPSKGIVEAVEGVVNSGLPIKFHIAGPDNFNIIPKLKEIAGEKWNKDIVYYGLLDNVEAMRLIEKCDGLILPSYYIGEAFPISILEAMKYGKLVIATPRAAIKDMLTTQDGSLCGILIEEKSSDSVKDALLWVHNHLAESNRLSEKAYNKVYESYRTEVVFEQCRQNYSELIKV